MFPKSSFVLGGAASGKSFWAEQFVKSYAKAKIYIATGQVFDAEMADRVRVHKNRRQEAWKTIEAPLDLTPALASATLNDVVLIDCATMWLSNQMLAENDLAQAQDALVLALNSCPAPWVMVSNEVGHGIVPDNALARSFREAQGRLNCVLAAQAELAVMVTAGLPQVLKGELP